MLLLDTNVVSELMRLRPEPNVLDWIAAQPVAELATTTITVMEIRFGIAVMPQGKRRMELDARFRQFLAQGFATRILAFDEAAADACADIRALRQRLGRPIAIEDSMIAAIARTRGGAVATRDISGFDGCGLTLTDPWER